MVTVTDNQAQTDVPAVIAELNRKFEGQFVVQKKVKTAFIPVV